MKIKEMTATFGCLERATLRPGEGLTLIEAPNESGKSTWTAFLRAMFYGFPARDRDKAGYLAEKNRYQPWSGAAMEGSITLTWQGRDLTLSRGPKGTVPWGSFQAVWTATQEPVEGLTGDNCGQVLLGVSREVFERTAFVSQGEVALTPSPDLEKRVAALYTSGEEEVSFSQVERRLKDWLNRRKVNSRVGLIPELEGELEQVNGAIERQGSLLRQLQEARQEKENLEAGRRRLEGQLQAHTAAQSAQQAQRRQQAQEELNRAQAAWEEAQRAAQALPPSEELRRAQGELSYLNTLTANQRVAENALPGAKAWVEQTEQAAREDPFFAGQSVAQAAVRAQRDYDRAKELERGAKLPIFLLVGALLGLVLGFLLVLLGPKALAQLGFSPGLMEVSASLLWVLLPCALLGMAIAALVGGMRSRRRGRERMELLESYKAQSPEDILRRGEEYGQKVADAQEAQRALQAVEAEGDKLGRQRQELKQALLDSVHLFAPEVTDLFGVSAALSRGLQQGEALALAQSRLEAAEQLLSALPAPAPGAAVNTLDTAPEGDPAALSTQLAEANRALSRAIAAAAQLQGELSSQGDRTELEARRETLREELERRQGEYEAITAALEGLKAADSLLQERFSPAVNERAGYYLSLLTGGKYHRAALTRQFQALAQAEGDGAARQDLALSAGAAQQLYLAVRLAMCELVFPQEESCFIVLDDVLDSFDERRAALALDCFLQLSQQRQVLLFSCHSWERAMLAGKEAVLLTPDWNKEG